MRNVYRWYRIAHYLGEHHVPVLPRAITLCIRLVFGCYIPHRATIGAGTKFGYGGIGVVIHDKSVIGRNCTIGQGVTLGGGRGGPGPYGTGVPRLGDNVSVGAGAKLLGPVQLGDNCQVGANAVVTSDVAANTVVAGVPARLLSEASDPAVAG